MAFAKLTVLALLALQSASVYADRKLAVEGLVKFPSNFHDTVFVIHGSPSRAVIELANKEPGEIGLESIWGVATTFRPPATELPSSLRVAYFKLEPVYYNQVILPDRSMTGIYEFVVSFPRCEIPDSWFPLKIRLRLAANITDGRSTFVLTIFNREIWYHTY